MLWRFVQDVQRNTCETMKIHLLDIFWQGLISGKIWRPTLPYIVRTLHHGRDTVSRLSRWGVSTISMEIRRRRTTREKAQLWTRFLSGGVFTNAESLRSWTLLFPVPQQNLLRQDSKCHSPANHHPPCTMLLSKNTYPSASNLYPLSKAH